MLLRNFLSSSLILSGLAIAAPAWALDDDQLTDTIIVSASRDDDGISSAILGASATAITPQDLANRQTIIVTDILRDVPGVSVNRTGGVGGITQVRIRGAESNHTLVLIDGIESSSPYDGEYDFNMLAADLGARIEVLRGEQSALYGSDAIGGVISYTSPSGRDLPGFAARVEGGSFGTVNGAVQGGGVSGKFDYMLGGTYASTLGYVVAPDGSRKIGSKIGSFNGKFGYDLGNITLRAVTRYSYSDADMNSQDFVVTGNAIDAGGSTTNSMKSALIGATYKNDNGNWTTDLSAQMVNAQRRAFDDNGEESYGATGKRRKVSLVSTVKLGDDNMSHAITGAVDYKDEIYRGTSSYFAEDNPFRSNDNMGFVGQYQLSIANRFGFGASLRHDINERFRDATTWRVQSSYRFDTATRLHAAVGTAMKAPIFTEIFGYDPSGGFIGNPNIKPEYSTGWEAGVEQTFWGDKVRIDITYFNAQLKDKITVVAADEDYNLTVVNAQGKSPHEGVEVSAAVRLPSGWYADASYTYLDATTEFGQRLVRRPKHIGSANLGWRAKDNRYGGNLTIRHNGAALDNNFATYAVETLDAFTIVNLSADMEIIPSMTLYGRVENLLDSDYRENIGFLPAGRAAYAGVRLRF
jgi:vitamin B12 transporter